MSLKSSSGLYWKKSATSNRASPREGGLSAVDLQGMKSTFHHDAIMSKTNASALSTAV